MINITTIINTGGGNTPEVQSTSDSNLGGFILAIVLLIVVAVIVINYAPGILRGLNLGGTTNVQVPGKIDVNVNKP
ncbi:MAG TPA: hypothetical protein VF185_02395 [Patescibacteria group bacterium]